MQDMAAGAKSMGASEQSTNEVPQPSSWVSCGHAQERLRRLLEATVPGIDHLEIEDMAAGTSPGCFADGRCGAHLRLTLVSGSFEGIRMLDRYRLIHTALQKELGSGAIHSLPNLQALTPMQWRTKAVAAHLRWVDERLRGTIPDLRHLEIRDVTNGHAVVGFADGSRRALDPNGLELELTVVSAVFDGLRLLERQRMVGDALAPELTSGAVHALPRLKTWTPQQWQAKAMDSERSSAAADAGSPKRQRILYGETGAAKL